VRPGGGGNEAYMASAVLLLSDSALADVCATKVVSVTMIVPTLVHSTVLDTPVPFITCILLIWTRTNVVPHRNFVQNHPSSPSF
jgi:hypothetical protein